MNADTTYIDRITAEHRDAFRNDLIDWYSENARSLPWRETDDPYLIWLSEVMLQQTRVDQAWPYFEQFREKYPTVEDLANADLDDVLHVWEGLGYYSRARYLHRAAQKIVNEYNGSVPDSYDEIQDLPGVGPYTAAAVVSIAFGRARAVLDGNVIRVLSRVLAIEDDVTQTSVKDQLREVANELLDRSDAGTFNQAVMELGALICTPNSPDCPSCPLNTVCEAYQDAKVTAFPVKSSRPSVPHYNIAVGLVFNDRNEVLIKKRPTDGMLGGLWEFPGGKQEEHESLRETCRRELREEMNIDVSVGSLFHKVNHTYSHLKVTLHAYPCRISEGTPEAAEEVPFTWAPLESLSEYAFPRANRKLIEKLEEQASIPTLFS